MSSQLTYKIQDLACRYKGSKDNVLEIDKLDIPAGSMTFIVGSSGVGKSTVLETLGLMNNTIVLNQNSKFEFYPNSDAKAIDLREIWQRSETELSNFRNEHLSFIFQNTNLFPTLTANENAIISLILQGEPKAKAIEKSRALFRNILPDLKEDRPITELSGGQRQRLAFIRAMISDFSVLLADEPTGNLDLINARGLIKKIKDQLNGRAAVVVSHDISLSLEFADQIVIINRIPTSNHGIKGKISSESVFSKTENSTWKAGSRELTDDLMKNELIQSIQFNEA
jgi:ABC-type lipoprotein export system ATPase subunit